MLQCSKLITLKDEQTQISCILSLHPKTDLSAFFVRMNDSVLTLLPVSSDLAVVCLADNQKLHTATRPLPDLATAARFKTWLIRLGLHLLQDPTGIMITSKCKECFGKQTEQ